MTDDSDSDGDATDSSDIKEAKVQDVVRAIRDCKGHYAFLIGAGTSKPAGIPTAGDLMWEWRQERYYEEHDADPDDVADDEIVDWAESFEDDHMAKSQNKYGFWFEQIHTTPGQRRHLIREKVENKQPTFGNIVLASLMSDEYIPLTLTPNFDDLVYDALYRFLEEKPLVINRDAVAAEFSLTRERPMIIKLHGDYLFKNLQNLARETNKLQENMERAFSLALNEYGLIVVGYGGNDASIMDEILLNDIDIHEYGIYWCARERSELSEKAEQLLEQENTYFVEIEGSEAFFTKLAKGIPGVSPPDEEDLRESAEKKIRAMKRTIDQREKEAESEEEEQYLSELQYRWKASKLEKEGEWEELMRVSSKLVELDPKNHFYYFIRGFARSNLGEYNRAIEDYNKAIDLDPEFAETYINRGNSYHDLGEHERAIEDYNKAIDLNPEYAQAYNNRGKSYSALSEYERAIEDYSKAIDLDPKYAKAYNNRGNLYHSLGEFERAIEDCNKAIDLNPELTQAYYNRGKSYHDLGEYDRAIEDYNKAIDLDPEYAQAYYKRGKSYSFLGEYEQAIEDYNKTIDLYGISLLLLKKRAEANIGRKKYKKACDDAAEVYKQADEPDDLAISLLLLVISKTVLDEAADELEQQYREVCTKDFTSSWDFTLLSRWIDKTDLDDEKEEYIRELIALLKDHREDT